MPRPDSPPRERRTRGYAFVAGSALLLSLAGCITPPATSGQPVGMTDADQAAADRAFATEPFGDQIRAGVLRQRTLYEHHFESGSPALNSLGRRDVAILAKGMSASGGRLSVQRGSADKELYAARLKSVRSALASAGIPAKRLKLDDGPPGGDGVGTIEAIRIRDDVRQGPLEVQRGEVLSNTGGEE